MGAALTFISCIRFPIRGLGYGTRDYRSRAVICRPIRDIRRSNVTTINVEWSSGAVEQEDRKKHGTTRSLL